MQEENSGLFHLVRQLSLRFLRSTLSPETLVHVLPFSSPLQLEQALNSPACQKAPMDARLSSRQDSNVVGPRTLLDYL